MIPPIINYTGNKYKRLEQILPLIPKHKTFYEPFCGSGVVGINSLDSGLSERVLLNDIDRHVTDLLFYMMSTSSFPSEAHSINNSYEPTEDGYKQLKMDYNAITKESHTPSIRFAMLYCLICRSFNNQIRFSKKKDEFNLPFGKRNTFNLKPQSCVAELYKHKSIGICSQDYQSAVSGVTKDDFVFIDPPYIKTSATYNVGWTHEKDEELYRWLDSLTDMGVRWMLTNTLKNRGEKNERLFEFINRPYIYVKHLHGTYSNSSYHKSSEKTVELMVTNYPKGDSDESIISANSSSTA